MDLKHILIATTILILGTVSVFAGSWSGGTVKNPSGSLGYKLWTPSAYKKENAVPLILMLHGCLQTAEEMAALSGMNDLADKENFLVVYPEQVAAANPMRCWNWFDQKNQSRDAGEPSLIAAVVNEVASKNNVNAGRVYVVGISAGGAMATVMAATYPELFAGLGVIAGMEYKAATTIQEGLSAMKQGGADPIQQGLLAFQAGGGRAKKPMPVIAFQGKKDPYVNPQNTEQLILQWAKTNDCLDDGKDNNSVSAQTPKETKGSVPGGYTYTKYGYKDGTGRLLMEKWTVEDLGHAWPGSSVSNQFADPKGPDATAEMWRFFGETAVKTGKKPATK